MQIKFVAHYFKNALQSCPLSLSPDIGATLCAQNVFHIICQSVVISWEERKQRKNVQQVQRWRERSQEG